MRRPGCRPWAPGEAERLRTRWLTLSVLKYETAAEILGRLAAEFGRTGPSVVSRLQLMGFKIGPGGRRRGSAGR